MGGGRGGGMRCGVGAHRPLGIARTRQRERPAASARPGGGGPAPLRLRFVPSVTEVMRGLARKFARGPRRGRLYLPGAARRRALLRWERRQR